MSTTTTTFTPSPTYDHALRRAAALRGVETEYWDMWGQRHEATEKVLRAILEALGTATGTLEQLNDGLEEHLSSEWSRLTPETLVIGASTGAIDISVPIALANTPIDVTIQWEGGEAEGGTADLSAVDISATANLRGEEFVRKPLHFPSPLRLGYHVLHLRAGEVTATTRFIVCPDRAYWPEALGQDGKAAGIAISVYGLRSQRNWGCGDFTDLRAAIDWAGEDGGSAFLALNPLHSIPNRQPYNTSPYLPNCSFYRNCIYVDVENSPDFTGYTRAKTILESASVRKEIDELRASQFVEYARVHRLKIRFLKLLFRRFLQDYRANTERAREFGKFVESEGELLDVYAVYCALEEKIHRRFPDVWLWTGWPEEYRDPAAPATRLFAQQYWRSVLFYKYVQWVLDTQLAAAHEYAKQKGMSIGLYHDLALATDRFGSDLWAHRSFYINGCRVGAPPDNFSPKGQDWSFPPPNSLKHREEGYSLFIDSIRKNCRHGGALRIDHVMRFFRLFWIPNECEATDGTYVLDRSEDLMRILALESVRQKVIVIGEDLGTVTDEFRAALQRFGILSYRLFYFEKDDSGRFKRPNEYPRQALVSITTHDLPTLAGFWINRDIEARREAGILTDEATYRGMLADRAEQKQKVLDMLHELQLVPGWFARSAADVPELSGELHNAVIGFLASTPSALMVVNQEDLTKEADQQNLPGSTAEYPNWSHKMRYTVEELRSDPLARGVTAMFRNWVERTGRAGS